MQRAKFTFIYQGI